MSYLYIFKATCIALGNVIERLKKDGLCDENINAFKIFMTTFFVALSKKDTTFLKYARAKRLKSCLIVEEIL